MICIFMYLRFHCDFMTGMYCGHKYFVRFLANPILFRIFLHILSLALNVSDLFSSHFVAKIFWLNKKKKWLIYFFFHFSRGF